MKFKVERICHTDSMSAIPMERIRFDLKASMENLKRAGHTVESHELFLAIKMNELDVTIYPSGRLLIHPLNDKPKAMDLAQHVFSFLIKETD